MLGSTFMMMRAASCFYGSSNFGHRRRVLVRALPVVACEAWVPRRPQADRSGRWNRKTSAAEELSLTLLRSSVLCPYTLAMQSLRKLDFQGLVLDSGRESPLVIGVPAKAIQALIDVGPRTALVPGACDVSRRPFYEYSGGVGGVALGSGG